MQKSKTLNYYVGVTLLAALIVAMVCLGLHGQLSVASRDSGVAPTGGESYEQVVRDEQMRWGHGHTLSDPSPSSAKPAASDR